MESFVSSGELAMSPWLCVIIDLCLRFVLVLISKYCAAVLIVLSVWLNQSIVIVLCIRTGGTQTPESGQHRRHWQWSGPHCWYSHLLLPWQSSGLHRAIVYIISSALHCHQIWCYTLHGRIVCNKDAFWLWESLFLLQVLLLWKYWVCQTQGTDRSPRPIGQPLMHILY